MKKDAYNPQPLNMTEGYFIDQQYDGYEMMRANIKNWKQLCPYQLRPDSLSGRLQVLQLHSMGSFSAYYTELFGENPSQILKTLYPHENDIEELCVTRQETM